MCFHMDGTQNIYQRVMPMCSKWTEPLKNKKILYKSVRSFIAKFHTFVVEESLIPELYK